MRYWWDFGNPTIRVKGRVHTENAEAQYHCSSTYIEYTWYHFGRRLTGRKPPQSDNTKVRLLEKTRIQEWG
jgi:hypothetical protein